MLEGLTVVYRSSVDVFIYVIGSQQENELILVATLNSIFDAISMLTKKSVEKRTLLSNLDAVYLGKRHFAWQSIWQYDLMYQFTHLIFQPWMKFAIPASSSSRIPKLYSLKAHRNRMNCLWEIRPWRKCCKRLRSRSGGPYCEPNFVGTNPLISPPPIAFPGIFQKSISLIHSMKL